MPPAARLLVTGFPNYVLTHGNHGAAVFFAHLDRQSCVNLLALAPKQSEPFNDQILRGRLEFADGALVTFRYDAAGRLDQADDTADPHRPITLAYDFLDRLLSETTSLGTVSYQYDASGRRRQMTVGGQASVDYTYDANSRLRTIAQSSFLSPVTIDYDALNRRTLLTLPNGVSTKYVYDPGSRLSALIYRNALGLLGDLTYRYDAGGNRIAVGGSFARTLLPNPVPSANYDAASRQLAFGDKSMTFDANGNLTILGEATNTITYSWDTRDRLVAIDGPGISGTFAYDASGSRIRRMVNNQTTTFHYDGGAIIRETADGGGVFYLNGPDIDEPLVRNKADGREFYLSDALGSILALTAESGALSGDYAYGPFGQTEFSGVPTTNPIQYTGRENDGTGLFYYRARYYNPSLGRFISEDPIRLASGDVNFYAYVSNNPIALIDPLGLAIMIQRIAQDPAEDPVRIALNFYADATVDQTLQSYLRYGAYIPALAVAPFDPKTRDLAITVITVGAAVVAGAQPAARGPLLPKEAWTRNAPRQVTPGTRTLEHTKFNPRTGELERSIAHYDQYGRQIGRTDYATHGRPQVHTSPHHHVTEYGPGYAPTGKESGPVPGPYRGGP